MVTRRLADYYVGIEVVVYMGITQVGLALPARLLVGRWVRKALQPSRMLIANPEAAQRLNRICEAVIRRWPTNVLCLQRSLALIWLLRRHGVSGDLKIGVRKDGPSLLAHAWVEANGQHLNDSAAHCSQFLQLHDATESLLTLRKAELAS
jgi:hypothetical protein